MQEQLEIIKEHLLGIWSKKHYLLISTWLLCPVAWLGISFMPNQYESEARVYVDTQTLLRPLMEGLMVDTNPNVQVQLILKTLLSRANLERIARMTDLDLKATTDEQYEAIIESLKERINISRTSRENIFTISTTASSPELAQSIVQSALTVFIENTLGESREDTDSAQKFINTQINEYEQRLVDAEIRLKNFRQKYYGSLPENTNSYTRQLANEKVNLKEAELALLEAKTRLQSAQAQLVPQDPKGAQNTNFTSQYDDRIKQLEETLDSLTLRFTDKHPDVKETQSRLEDLRAKREQEIDELYRANQENPDAINALSSNVVYQEMKILVNQLKNDVASLTARVANYKNQINELNQQILTIPEVDAEFTGLNRDYNIIKARYEELLERQESAHLARSAEQSTEKIQFRVIDPPQLALQASGPIREVFFVLALLGSIAVGAVIAFLQVQLNPKVISTSQLTRTIGLPIFGVISATSQLNKVQATNRSTKLFIASNSLFALLLVTLIIAYNYPPLAAALTQGVA